MVIDAIYHSVQMISFLSAMVYFANLKVVDSFKKIPFLLAFAVVTIAVGVIQRYSSDWIVLALIMDIVMWSCVLRFTLGVPLKDAITSVLFGYFVVCMAEATVLVLGAVTKMNMSKGYPINVQTMLIFMLVPLLTYLILKYIPFLRFKNSIKSSQYIVVLIILVSSFLYIYIYATLTHQYTFIPGISNSAILIATLVLILDLVLEEMSERRRNAEMYYYETYLPIVDQMIKSIQVTQHSYNNQIMTFKGIIDLSSDKDEIIKAFEKITNENVRVIKEDYSFLHLENRMLAGLLYQKNICAEEKGFNLHFTIRQNTFKSELSDFDIIDITGILIDNALEHSDDGCKDIYITLGQSSRSDSAKYYIMVENAGSSVTSDYIAKMFKKSHTTKSDKVGHGLGMYILKSKVNKHKGKVSVFNTDRDGVRMIAIEVEV
ncbi:MAG: GHKL domain-containing protein [Lachnospiraceae bacterium]|nr:GHKL domain-containing protein [Lachnospiraceae bacterium]